MRQMIRLLRHNSTCEVKVSKGVLMSLEIIVDTEMLVVWLQSAELS